MSVLVELKTKLDAAGLSLGPIRVGQMPNDPNVMGALYEYGGQDPERKFGSTAIRIEKPAVQLVFRGEPHDYDGPRDRAMAAWAYLTGVTPGALGAGVTTVYEMIKPQQSPFPLGAPDNLHRFKFACNFIVEKEPSAL